MRCIGLLTAKLAKEAGFDGYTEDYYSENEKNPNEFIHGNGVRQWNQLETAYDHEYLAAPFQEDLRDWLRRKHGIHVMVKYHGRYFAMYKRGPGGYTTVDEKFKDYYDALDEALKEGLFLIIKSQKDDSED